MPKISVHNGTNKTLETDGNHMKLRNKIALSILAGFLAMMLYSTPMWWGVLFSPIAQPLATEQTSEATGICWESDGIFLRFKSIDLLLSFLHLS